MAKDSCRSERSSFPYRCFGGSLADMDPCDLASTVMKEAIARSNVDPARSTTSPSAPRCRPTPVTPTFPRVLPSRLACRWIPSPCRFPACAPPACRPS